MKKKILVSGSLAYDRIMDFRGKFSDYIMADKIHALSVCFVIDKVKVNFGGTAGNIGYNLKLLGEEPIILSQAGKDFGEYKRWLVKNKISLDGVRILKNKNTASAHIITDRADNQITALHLETMAVASGINEKKVKKFNNIGLAIISPGNIKDMMDAARIYKKLNIPYIADPGQQIPVLSKRELEFLIKGAEVLIVNDYEEELTKKKLKKQIRKLVNILIITYGAKGSVILNNNKKIKIKAVKPKKIVDPTGAGDAYRAGFMKGFIAGWDLRKCGELASRIAKYPLEYYGTQEHDIINI